MNNKLKDRSKTSIAASTLLDESAFARFLALERRRCERTGEPFVLMLLDLDELPGTLKLQDFEAAARSVSITLRDTDQTGWYKESSTIGVILTALNGTDPRTVEPPIVDRIREELSRILGPAQLQAVRISCHVFPEDRQGSDSSHWTPDRIFYSDGKNDRPDGNISAILKRTLDLVGSSIALVVLVPLFIVISVLIKLTSPGPVFFRQERYGLFGKKFTFLKFRSMYTNNDPEIHKDYVRNLIDSNVGGGGRYL